MAVGVVAAAVRAVPPQYIPASQPEGYNGGIAREEDFRYHVENWTPQAVIVSFWCCAGVIRGGSSKEIDGGEIESSSISSGHEGAV